jgi:hypothetical protein
MLEVDCVEADMFSFLRAVLPLMMNDDDGGGCFFVSDVVEWDVSW